MRSIFTWPVPRAFRTFSLGVIEEFPLNRQAPRFRFRPLSIFIAAFVFFASIGMVPIPAGAKNLTREQGDAILNELRQIRTLLERQQQPPAQPLPPAPEKVTLKLGAEYSLGRGDAPVVIVEYTDYECGYCNLFYTVTYPGIRKNFIDTGKARFVKRDLALDFHPNALKAAQAARCAGDQGKFWEMHDILSMNPDALGPEAYAKYARDIGLDAEAFKTCAGSDKYIAEIRESGKGAGGVGITGTPSFVVGTVTGDTLDGIKIVGAHPYAVFEKAIEDSIAAQSGGNAPK
jgi:protein-disulfide isomerase